jgi:hypothetical protein
MPARKFLDICHDYFFVNKEIARLALTPDQLNKLARFEEAFTMWLAHPSWTDLQVVDHLKQNYGISNAQAYRDCYDIKSLLNSVNAAKKEWERYKANHYIDQGYDLADNATDKLDILKAQAMIAAGKAKSSVNRLDHVDPHELPFDKIVPNDFEPVYDPLLLESKRKSPTEIQEEILNMYRELGDITDAEVVE